MRFKPVIMIVLAVVFGGSAIAAGNSWLQRQAAQQRISPAAAPVPAATIVVAASPLRYGDEVTALEAAAGPVAWRCAAAGAFGTIGDVTGPGEKRVVLAAIEPNEPLLQDQGHRRGTARDAVHDDRGGMGAVTIQVDEVVGLAGFVLPGEGSTSSRRRRPRRRGPEGRLYRSHPAATSVCSQSGRPPTSAPTSRPSSAPSRSKSISRRAEDRARRQDGHAVADAAQGRRNCFAADAPRRARRNRRRRGGADGDAVSIRVTRRLAQTSYAVPKSEAFAERNIAAPARRSVPVAQNTRSVNQVEASFFDR